MKATHARTAHGRSADGHAADGHAVHAHTARLFGALVALVVALFFAGVGVAGAVESADAPSASIGAGANGPTTTVDVDGGQIELIPATSYKLPPTSTEVPTSTADPASSAIEVQGVSSTTGPTAAAGVDSPVGSITWIVVGAIVILGGAALLWTRTRRAARH